jgi:hypothetical protein
MLRHSKNAILVGFAAQEANDHTVTVLFAPLRLLLCC